MAVTSPRSSETGRRAAPLFWGGEVTEWIRKVAEVVNQILDGKINSIGSVTLTASSATTTLTDLRIGVTSKIFFSPTTANAATATANLRVTATGKQTATLTHANNSQTDRAFDYVVLG
jgi:hypothetical protein